MIDSNHNGTAHYYGLLKKYRNIDREHVNKGVMSGMLQLRNSIKYFDKTSGITCT